MKRVFLVAYVFVLAGCCSAAAGSARGPSIVTVPETTNGGGGAGAPSGGAPSASAGRWCGEVVQQGYPPYPMVMVLSETQAMGGACGTTDYASLGCTGRLTCAAPEGGLPRYLENLTSGQERCVEGGVFTVRLDGESLFWDYRRPDGQLDATATLHRCTQ